MSAPGPARKTETSRDDWETPPALFDLLNAEFHFHLDAAADAFNHKCTYWLSGPCTGEEGCLCGLCAVWLPDWWENLPVWLNPPYGRGLDLWVRKCAKEALAGCTVVALLPANTDTGWFRELWDSASELRFLSGRVQFVGTTSSNPGGSVVAIFRPPVKGLSSPGPVVSLWSWR